MNCGQALVLLVGCCVMIGMGLYVPKADIGASKHEDGSVSIWMESSGYHFILDNNDLVVDVPRLVVQWIIVAVITFLLYRMCSTKGRARRFTGPLAMLDGAVVVRRRQSNHRWGRTIVIRKRTREANRNNPVHAK